jgi:hypothetical protein
VWWPTCRLCRDSRTKGNILGVEEEQQIIRWRTYSQESHYRKMGANFTL